MTNTQSYAYLGVLIFSSVFSLQSVAKTTTADLSYSLRNADFKASRSSMVSELLINLPSMHNSQELKTSGLVLLIMELCNQ